MRIRPRDNQRSRCYEWENKAILTAHTTIGVRYATLEECEDFMRPIWRAERGRVGLAKHRPPELSRNLWGQRSATSGHDHVIKLPLWARTPWIILHEMAHRFGSCG